jgi:FkbH-like protein
VGGEIRGPGSGMIENKVKLVIWDLDETFWNGTLAEEGIAPIDVNAARVIALSKRGIVNSICSKNDYERAKAKLLEIGIWDYFVFPSISFNPKGKAIAGMIEGAALRAENVLFIDDNPSNLEEAKYFNPGIMVAHPRDVLDGLLDHPNLEGKPDPDLTRLKQYQFLQKKVEEKNASSLSNEEFLRQSNIRVTIDYDVDANFERILELINRSNQLNYTKIRVEKPKKIERFREMLDGTFGVHAGCVHAKDNYGDYGLIGFFLMRQNPRGKKLIHFVFSCRTMNMGIEQYVYELLGRPEIEIAEPVSYGVQTHARVDWINADAGSNGEDAGSAHKLVLLGGCDLLQLASYCSTDRIEFVNHIRNDVKVCYEDPSFIMGDRAVIRDSGTLRKLSYWTYEDCQRFDAGVTDADLVLISMWPAMNGESVVTDDGVELRMAANGARSVIAKNPGMFGRELRELQLDDDASMARVTAAFDALRGKIRDTCRVFVMGIYSQSGVGGNREARRVAFNKMCRDYCARHAGRFTFVDFDTIVPSEYLIDGMHFSRQGYFEIAQFILNTAHMSGPALAMKPQEASAV